MSSQAQQAANAANAQKSTGPRTEQGKARVAQNARKHGLTSAHFEVAPEDQAEYEALEAGYREDIQPLTTIQEMVFLQLVQTAWKLYVLLPRMESQAMAGPGAFQALERLSIYRARIERSYYRHQKELTSLQERCMLKHAMMQHSPTYPALVDVGRIRKEMEAYFKNQPPQNKQSQDEEMELEYIRQIEEEATRFEALAQQQGLNIGRIGVR
jgi:hypothetical protein